MCVCVCTRTRVHVQEIYGGHVRNMVPVAFLGFLWVKTLVMIDPAVTPRSPGLPTSFPRGYPLGGLWEC